MANLIIENTGVDHLYPDGVPIAEVTIAISDIYKKVARLSSLAVQADPYFNAHTSAQKLFSELHGESDRITRDMLEEGAKDISPVFASMQRWMTDAAPGPTFEFDLADSGNIIYRWQIMDTRLTDDKLNYTNETIMDIRNDIQNLVTKVEKYLVEALKDYVLQELYRAIGYDKKYVNYHRSYQLNRQQVAFWAKNDKSLQTQYSYAGV
jgi:hypothetical protein